MNWKNYTERPRADGGISRFIHPKIGGKQTWIRIPEDPKYRGKKGYERFLAETLAEAIEKITTVRFDDAAVEWLSAHEKGKPSTFENYSRVLKLHLIPYFGNEPLNNITSKDLIDFVTA